MRETEISNLDRKPVKTQMRSVRTFSGPAESFFVVGTLYNQYKYETKTKSLEGVRKEGGWFGHSQQYALECLKEGKEIGV